MHILLTVNAAWNIWNFRRPVVESLLAGGHQVTVLAPKDEYVPHLVTLGCRFVPLNMDVQGLNPATSLQLMLRMRKAFRAERPDVIFSYTIKNNIFGALAAKSCSIPFIPNVTGLGTAFLSGGLLRNVAQRLYRRAFTRLPVIFFQNEDDRDLFVEKRLVNPAQAHLLPGSGIDLTRFSATPQPSEQMAPTFLMISRLMKDKGVLEYVEAARIVKTQVPNARFQILGPIATENRTALNQITVSEWEREGVIEYLGTTADVRPHIANAHCVVLPSYREGAPRTLIEAAATRLYSTLLKAHLPTPSRTF